MKSENEKQEKTPRTNKINMKQIELNLQKRLLIVEPYGELIKNKKNSDLYYCINCDDIETRFADQNKLELICKGSELTEEIADEFVDIFDLGYFVYYNHHNPRSYKHTALESFISAIEAQGYYWGKNPIEQPFVEKYGWYTANSQEEESGWMYEEGEDKYYEALKEWQEAESKTFNLDKTLIFEILL